MKAEVYNNVPLVRINAPEIFQDPAFKEWFLHRPGVVAGDHVYPPQTIATWHRMSEQEFGEYSDFFTIVDFLGGEEPEGDGSESDMPEHIWKQLLHAAWLALNKPSWHIEALLWISNLKDEEPPSPEWHLQSLVIQLSRMGYNVLHKKVLTQLLDRSEIHVEAVNLAAPDLLKLTQMGLKIMSPSVQGTTACWCLQFDGPRRLLRRNIQPEPVLDNVNVEPPSGTAESNA